MYIQHCNFHKYCLSNKKEKDKDIAKIPTVFLGVQMINQFPEFQFLKCKKNLVGIGHDWNKRNM